MKTKQPISLIVFLALIMAGCSGAGTFKTPEDAITYYFEGVAQGGTDKILRACAINEMSENFEFDLFIERARIFQAPTSLSPTYHPLYIEANKLELSSQVMNRVKLFAYSLLSSEEIDFRPTLDMDAERVARFMKDVDPKRLANLEIIKIDLPDKTLMNSDKYLEYADWFARSYGADESTERVALFSFEQNYYYVGFTLLRYGDNWKISSQYSPTAGTDTLGTPQKTTEEEFERMINRD